MPLISPPASLHEELPLHEIASYPDLQRIHEHWMEIGAPPATLDPARLPRHTLPYVMVLAVEEEPRSLRVRLAGTRFCDEYGTELRGLTTDDFFQPADAAIIAKTGFGVAMTGVPSIARKTHITINERYWSYIRLILPLSKNGRTVDRLFKVLDPSTISMVTKQTP